MTDFDNRRPLKSRQAPWAEALAASLGRAGVSPDLISACSVALAVLGAAVLCWAGLSDGIARVVFLVIAMLCIQGRLLANMLDGMVAVEHHLASPAGALWNELPDRFADVLFLAGAGYGAYAAGQTSGPTLGWICAVLAIATAYVRELGKGLGLPADFCGPMAKTHRMFALTGGCAVSIFEPLWHWRGQALWLTLIVIALGGIVTVARRIVHLNRGLKAKAPAN